VDTERKDEGRIASFHRAVMPRLRRVARVVAVANQKGGVGKTTTVHSLGFALAELGQRVLLIDLDPQACLTYSTGLDPSSLNASLHDVFVRTMKAADARYVVRGINGLHILPATIDLASTEVHLLTRTAREHVLRRALKSLQDEYDMILIDCPPSLGILAINGLCAADEVLIPLQCETLCSRGVGQLIEMIDDVRMFANADLTVRGIINTIYDERTSHGRIILAEVKERYGLEVLEPPVRKSVRFAEAPEFGRCILQHAPSSAGAEAYRTLARELAVERHLVG
jgi:chromosome partitioning protein